MADDSSPSPFMTIPTPEQELRARFLEIDGMDRDDGARDPLRAGVSIDALHRHTSQTINQLVGDRNATVGWFMAVASLLINASALVLTAPESARPIVPLERLQFWCLPATFCVLTILAMFFSAIPPAPRSAWHTRPPS